MKISSLKEINEAVNLINEAVHQIKNLDDSEKATDKNEDLSEKLDNLGVKTALSAIGKSVKKSEIASHPAFSYMFEKLVSSSNAPEWMIIENVIASLTPFNWVPLVAECIKNLKENADKYREEITIYKIKEGFKAPSSSYLYSVISEGLETYLHERNSSDRVRVMEAASKYLFDPNMKALYNFLAETENSFNISATDNTCTASRVYSPVLITEACEFFVAGSKVYKKFENTISVANENEVAALPESFQAVAQILEWSNVAVNEGQIKIYSGDKIIEISEGETQPAIKINNKPVALDQIHTVYLNSGIFRVEERNNINAVYILVENWDSILEMDFAKVIRSQADTNKQVTLFFLGENIYINKVNRLMNEDFFYSKCTAIQANNLLVEFMKFDASSAFSELMNEEEKQLKKSSALKSEYAQAIDHLTNQKTMLESVSSEAKNSSEVKELIQAIDEEIDLLKKEYGRLTSAEHAVTHISEGMSFNVGDEAELEKKR